MLASPKVMDALKTIGLNQYERKLFVALLSRKTSTAGELAEISGVPRSRCYDVLESLAERGFVIVQPGKPIKYVVVPPKEALSRQAKNLQNETDEMIERIEELKESEKIEEMESLYKEGVSVNKLNELTGALKGRPALLQQMNMMFNKAEKNIKLFTTDVGLVELYKNYYKNLKDKSKSGVNLKIAAPINENNRKVAQELAAFADVRDVSNKSLPTGRMAIVDGNEFVFALTRDSTTHPTQELSFWTESDHASSEVLEPLFNLVWSNAKKLKAN